jgi:hypothetical protein
LELARRFQIKYGSGDGSDSNAAPYFIGVFDTVTALGASGFRRRMIELGLTAGVAAAAFAASLLPAAFVGTLFAALSGAGLLWGFVVPAWFVTHLAMLIPIIAFWRSQKATHQKTIYDFPNKGDPPRSHDAEWKGENFDKLLSKYVRFARSANAIDETRKDFARVAWGGTEPPAHPSTPGVPRFVQLWFAGNHSDIGGSYAEPESRLSDVALAWMCEQATSVPDGLKTGPIFVNEQKMRSTGDVGFRLEVFPSADGVQHCEIAGMRDMIDGYAAKLPRWTWLQRLVAGMNWEAALRPIRTDAPVHPTVDQRFGLEEVTQCAGSGTYRPESLRNHDKFKYLYPPETQGGG